MKVQGVECPRCKEQIWSVYRHDFHYCRCGYTFVDGGRDYLRYGHGVEPRKRFKNGRVPKSEWKWMTAENKRIGTPTIVDIEVPDPEPTRPLTEKEKIAWLTKFYFDHEDAMPKVVKGKKAGRKKKAKGEKK